jgi:hypothetical protein
MISRSDAEVRRRLIVELGWTGMALKKGWDETGGWITEAGWRFTNH